jgi:hypothetical protein
MRRIRQIAFVILFAGWLLPAALAQAASERTAKKPRPRPRTQLELMYGVEAPPDPADRVVSTSRAIAGIWFFVAVAYAGVLAVRLRRTLIA